RADSNYRSSHTALHESKLPEAHGVINEILLDTQAIVGGGAISVGFPKQGIEFLCGPRHNDLHIRQAVQDGHIRRPMVGHPLRTVIIRSPVTDEFSTKLLVTKVVLDLFKGAFHQERYNRVHDGYETFQRQA